jgi:hypothetical protein
MVALRPYADDSASASIGELTVENGRDCVTLYGSLDLTRDKVGLAHARALLQLAQDTVKVLEAAHDLPDAVPPPEKPGTVKNPFA